MKLYKGELRIYCEEILMIQVGMRMHSVVMHLSEWLNITSPGKLKNLMHPVKTKGTTMRCGKAFGIDNEH